MGTIFLSGGGDKKHTEKFDQEFRKQIGISKPLLYIPIAMKGIASLDDCCQWMKSVFNPLGLQEIVMWPDLNHKSLKDLQQFSAIYIGGGNTFSLLNDMRSSYFDEVLKEYINSGGVVYGGSAGAIILGSDIMTCAHLDPNEVNLKNYNGLNLMADLAIWCHYELQNDDQIRKYIKKYKKPVLALPEETGAYFNDGCIKITGTKPALLFREEKKIDLLPGSEHTIY
jgi:dipeptidase E